LKTFPPKRIRSGERARTKRFDRTGFVAGSWAQSIENLINEGVETFVEVGAGKVLSGLVGRLIATFAV
jgi:malonyl CoA-acyl carrier protein transacylase